VVAMTEFWQHALVAAAVIVLTIGLAKFVDWRISRRDLAPDVETRYRVLGRIAVVVIVFVGVMSALLVIPQVRAIAGGVLASSAVIGLIIGFAAQRTIGNLVAGVLIARIGTGWVFVLNGIAFVLSSFQTSLIGSNE